MCGGKVNEIPLLGMPEEWYQFVKSDGKDGIPPKSYEDAMIFLKNYQGIENICIFHKYIH